jgi:tetratricopeptide (TPR) repeat protein
MLGCILAPMESWLAAIALIAFQASTALGQPGDQIPNMQVIAQGLGVKCEYCHAGQRGTQPSGQPSGQQSVEGQPRSKFEIARAMIAMTRDLNTKILAATGKPPSETTQVTCVTCHRGIAVPGQLSDIIARTALEQGPDAAIAQYRDLRQRYYGGQSYDFREDTLLDAAQKLVRVKPKTAIPVLQLNLEFYPKSVRSYIQIAFAYTRNLDDDSAIATLEKALELEPDNGMVKGQLEQLKSYHRKR